MLKNVLHFDEIITHSITDEKLALKNIRLDVLRADRIHEVVSGNKWFKLSLYLKDAMDKGFKTIGTFGGAYSNHIIATAFAANISGLNSIGLIRGERAKLLSQTLLHAMEENMELRFLSRSDYKNPQKFIDEEPHIYWIPEGGYGIPGAEGAKEMLSFVPDLPAYDYIVAATGTGTMLAGLIKAISDHQKVIGISVMKGNFELTQKVKDLLTPAEQLKNFELVHDFHFGGYAKHPQQLLDFINELWRTHNLPTDIVYTSKTLFAIFSLIDQNFFKEGTKILMIHSGGLQGNSSLAPQTLRFC